MFTEVTSAPQNIQLFTLDNGVFASTGPDLARANRGRLEMLPRVRVVGPADGVGSPPPNAILPLEVLHLFGRWPDSAWATVNLGWKATGAGSGAPTYPVPDHAVVRWSDTRKVWIKQLDLNWVWSWPGGVLAGGLDGQFRWAEDKSWPVPPVLLSGTIGNGRTPPILLWTTDAGDVFVNLVQSAMYEQGWWAFPRGQATGERLITPPGIDPRSLTLHTSRDPDVLYATDAMASGDPYLGIRTRGSWQQLPPPIHGRPEDRFHVELFESSSGWLIASVRISATNETVYYKLTRGSTWQALLLKRPFADKEVDRQMLVVGKDDDLWLSVRLRGSNRSVLYHASL